MHGEFLIKDKQQSSLSFSLSPWWCILACRASAAKPPFVQLGLTLTSSTISTIGVHNGKLLSCRDVAYGMKSLFLQRSVKRKVDIWNARVIKAGAKQEHTVKSIRRIDGKHRTMQFRYFMPFPFHLTLSSALESVAGMSMQLQI